MGDRVSLWFWFPQAQAERNRSTDDQNGVSTCDVSLSKCCLITVWVRAVTLQVYEQVIMSTAVCRMCLIRLVTIL